MPGLYQKALEIYKRQDHLRLVRPGEINGAAEAEPEQEISGEEREKILAEIDRRLDKSRIRVVADTFSFTPKRSGAFLPVLVNAIAVILLLGSILFLFYVFDRSEESILSETAEVLSTESKLIAALKKESEEQLELKDQKILDIQVRLNGMQRERERIKLAAQAEIQQREQQLRAEMEEALQAEREKLQSQGLSTENIAEKIKEYEAQKKAEFETRVEALRTQSQAELAQKEATIAALVSEYEQSLESAQQERLDLQRALENREARLEEQFREREQALESDRSRAIEELSRMRDTRQNEQLILDQILSSYDKINNQLKDTQYADARNGLEALREYLNQDSVSSLPAIQKRRPVELFIIGSLESLIANEQPRESEDISSLVESSNLINSATTLVKRGDASFESENLPEAEKWYLAAIQEIPPVGSGFSKLEEIRRLAADRASESRRSRLEQLLAEADRFYTADDFQPSLERYRQALIFIFEDAQTSQRTVNRIMQAGYMVLSAEERAALARLERESDRNKTLIESLESASARQAALIAELDTDRAGRNALLDRLTAARQRFETFSRSRDSQPDELTPEVLATLLETKILIKQLIVTEPARSRYPGLYDAMVEYFEVYGNEKLNTGKNAALADAIMLIDIVLAQRTEGESSRSGQNLDAIWERYAVQEQNELLLRLMSRLTALLQ